MSKSTTVELNSKMQKRSVKPVVELQVIRPRTAGIDIGDTFHAVAVAAGCDPEPVRIFGAFTVDLQAIVAWLKQCHVESVAMESTGVYWKPLYALLIRHGFEVYLVNARQTKNVSGRKTDMSDAAWIQMLHSCGLLTSSFLPDDRTETLRTLVRQRKALLRDSARCIQRIQKNLELMNLKIHTVISDIMGKTGEAILKAMIAGERNASGFLPLIDKRIKASEEDILKSMEGNWRPECLFLIRQCYSQYNQLQDHMQDCDKEIELVLAEMAAAGSKATEEEESNAGLAGRVPATKKKKNKNAPVYDLRDYLHQIHGTDVMNIFGISEISALEILAETGTGLARWPTANHFVSWLNFCPNNKITGGKLISSKIMKKKPNIASQAFRAAANGVAKSQNWLGDYFRRMKSKGGNRYAIVATARKLALIYYRLVHDKDAFKAVDIEDYRQKQRQAKINYLEKRLEQLRTHQSQQDAA